MYITQELNDFILQDTSSGKKTSFRDNPYRQARRHADDLHHYLSQNLKVWFPGTRYLVVFATKDMEGVNGVNLYHVRRYNSSLIYLDEMLERISNPGDLVRGWDKWDLVADLLNSLPTRP